MESQNTAANASGESFSQLVQLYHYADTQLTHVKTIFSTLMENVALQQKKFSNELRSETSLFVEQEIEKMELSTFNDPDTIKSKISNCAKEVDDMIDAWIEQFINILNDAERDTYALEDKLRKEPSSDDIDEINDEVDDIIDDFKGTFEETFVPLLEDLLFQIKKKNVSLRSDLRTCIDKILN